MRSNMKRAYILGVLLIALGSAAVSAQDQPPSLALPTSKALSTPAAESAQRTNSFPVSAALSPNGKYLAVLNAGFGSGESHYCQSIAIVELATGQLRDFPDTRLGADAKQSYFVGLAWNSAGTELYASFASLTDPQGKSPNSTGNGIAVYSFANGQLTPARFLKLPLVTISENRRNTYGAKQVPAKQTISYPAGLAVVKPSGGDALLIAENLADDVVLIDIQDGHVRQRFPLGRGKVVPSTFPYTVVANRAGTRAWCSLWNGSSVAELDLPSGKVVRKIALLSPKEETDASSHPTAVLLNPDENKLYVTLANRDKVAIIATADGKVDRCLDARLPHQKFGGNYPVALALSTDSKTLYVADSSSDAVAVFDLRESRGTHSQANQDRASYFIPTEWYPTAVVVRGTDLFVATGKGSGTGPNSSPQTVPEPGGKKQLHPYIASLIHGLLAQIALPDTERNREGLTSEVLTTNRMEGRTSEITFARGGNPIHHVIYIIKENRTYDQIFGDIKEANGDPSLVMYGLDITPNQHKLARQFGVLDNFYDSGEVSGDGHIWSMAAIPSDYLERWYPINYRSSTEHTYDGEGFNSSGVPLLEGVPDVNGPGTGFLWENAARNHITYRDYGEFAAGQWCTAVSDEGYVPPPEAERCPIKSVAKGEPLPANVGQPHGSPSPYSWSIPVLGGVVPMKAALRDHVDPNYFPWNLDVPDQLRIDEFLNEFDGFVRARKAGSGETLPALVIMRLGDDHTSGTRAGHPKPQAQVADNDLAVGRLVDAVSHSPYWDDTAIFILEDDAQNGADHVDAHRSTALVISKYSPRPGNSPFVDSTFYTTVNMVRTVEAVTGLPPMNNNDGRAAVMAPLFSGKGDQPAFVADYGNRDNGLIYQANAPTAPGAA